MKDLDILEVEIMVIKTIRRICGNAWQSAWMGMFAFHFVRDPKVLMKPTRVHHNLLDSKLYGLNVGVLL
jgi:hypothetical protein